MMAMFVRRGLLTLYHYTEQETEANRLRDSGNTFKMISESMLISPSRAREIYVKYKKKEKLALKYQYPITTVKSLIDNFNKKENYQSLMKDFLRGKSIEAIA